MCKMKKILRTVSEISPRASAAATNRQSSEKFIARHVLCSIKHNHVTLRRACKLKRQSTFIAAIKTFNLVFFCLFTFN